jgi:enoyl-CoA hydratase
MSSYSNILVSVSNLIATITINRPDKLNALNELTLTELKNAITETYTNDDVRAVIITGSGEKAFVAGADIPEIAKLNMSNGSIATKFGQDIFFLIENSPKPIIAAVNGYALGGGCELALACHMRVAAENAIFGQPEITLGIIPGYGGTQRLTQLVGKGKAMELMLTADSINAETALKLGLVNYVVAKESLIEKCTEILNKIISKPALAVGKIIKCINHNFDKDENGYLTESALFNECTETLDFKEGTTAFLEKRKPIFVGK